MIEAIQWGVNPVTNEPLTNNEAEGTFPSLVMADIADSYDRWGTTFWRDRESRWVLSQQRGCGHIESPNRCQNDVFWCRKLVMAVFGVMVALNMAGETKIELLFQMPMSMRITADAARK
jgi:hypothetical protein